MKISILSVGKIKQSFVIDGEGEYLKRLKNDHKITLTELGLDSSQSMSATEVKKKEGREALSKIPEGFALVVLDEKGEQLNSGGFAKLFKDYEMKGLGIIFAIGGAYGWDEEVKKKASKIISLSPLTFPYQLTRLILIEQIYRATTINKGLPYHK